MRLFFLSCKVPCRDVVISPFVKTSVINEQAFSIVLLVFFYFVVFPLLPYVYTSLVLKRGRMLGKRQRYWSNGFDTLFSFAGRRPSPLWGELGTL